MQHNGLRTWIEIDTKTLKHNYTVFRKRISRDCKLMAVAKSNAYGHSLVDFTKTIISLGADWIGVDSITEARALRDAGIKKPILVLGYTLPELYREAAEQKISVTISNAEALHAALKIKYSKPLHVHIKVDTGMRRQGFFPDEIPRVAELLSEHTRSVVFEGLYTHFAAAKNPAFPHDTKQQLAEFYTVIREVEKRGYRPMKHASATAGTLLFSEAHFDMVRVGIGLYGYWPSKETRAALEDSITLKPALTWKTIIGELKSVERGDRIGYDLTETFDTAARIAICPIGYWHGYPRALSSIGHVRIKANRARVVGRVSMDMIALDVSRIKNIRVGDEIILIGPTVPAEEIADLIGNTINYEVITRINPLIKRIYT